MSAEHGGHGPEPIFDNDLPSSAIIVDVFLGWLTQMIEAATANPNYGRRAGGIGGGGHGDHH